MAVRQAIACAAELSIEGADIDATKDPVSDQKYGPPDAIECINCTGTEQLDFECDDGAGVRSFTNIIDRETFEGIGAIAIKATSTVPKVRLRWRQGRT